MTNRLAQSNSLYLRKHAENPVDWWPWSEEALEKAQKEDKPIFLSVGYSSCHWCTVMEGEAFSDPAIAEYLNAQFLPIKVDREERPDVDSIYMQAVQMMIGQGGWPLNVFLTPGDLVPFYGGTYFPIQPRYGRPGFLQVLQALRSHYDTQKDKLAAQKNELMRHLERANSLHPVAILEAGLLQRGIQENTTVIAQESAGTRFPMIPYAELALRGSRFNLQAELDALSVCTQRGLDLALGGIYDHVGGGFHRYTVDPNWTVPHFEKMLYDNGLIMEYLANLWGAGVQEPAIRRAIAGTVQWLQREMTAPAGYFYAAQDADNFVTATDLEPEEGRFYVWTFQEMQDILDQPELTELAKVFNISKAGNFESNCIVLQRQALGELPTIVETALAKLFAVRYGSRPDNLSTFPPARNNQEAKSQTWPGRIPPVTDPKMIVAWNSLMISGLAKAATIFDQPSYLELAATAAQFILDYQWVEGRLHRINYDGKAEVPAQSEDYALLVKALLDLHQANLVKGNASEDWWIQAHRVQQEFDQLLWSSGGYYNTASDTSQELLVRERSWIDNATPAANGVAIANLVRLALRTENIDYLAQAEQALKAFAQMAGQAPQACPSLFTALDWYQNHTLIRTTAAQMKGIAQQYFPTVVYALESNLPTGAVGLVCQGLSCQEPARSAVQLQEQVQQSQLRLH